MLLSTLHSELEAEIHVGSVWVSVALSPGVASAKVAGDGNQLSSHLLIFCWAPQPGPFPPGTQQDLTGAENSLPRRGCLSRRGGVSPSLAILEWPTMVIFIHPQEHDPLEPQKRVAESIRGRWSE